MQTLLDTELRVRMFLTALGAWVGLLPLRILLGYEFWEAGVTKLGGENWFDSLAFPFPFNLLSADTNWLLASWSETLFAVCLFLGLGTRFAAVSLTVVTWVAIYAAHLPERLVDGTWVTVGISSWDEFWAGWAISEKCADGYCTGNYKLPLMYVLMFIPLLLLGGGKLSVDHLIARATGREVHQP